MLAGVKLMLTPVTSAMFASSGMLAPDGRCKTLATTADGYGRGEACATIVFAQQVLGVGRPGLVVYMGSAVNQDGRSGSLTAPNGPAQQRAIHAALLAGAVSAQVKPSCRPIIMQHSLPMAIVNIALVGWQSMCPYF